MNGRRGGAVARAQGSVAAAGVLEPIATASGAALRRRRRRRALASNAAWYVVLTALAAITVFPFLWMLLTSLKGPADPITSVPPQFIPGHPTLANYQKVLDSLPILKFFQNSIVVSIAVTGLNVLVSAMAAYPLAKMRFRGRDAIFYLLLATLIVPAQLTYIPSFILAVNTFHYYDTLPSVILPSLASAFNIFLMRQAFRGVPNDLIDAARVDGAGEWRVWWQILLPIVRPSMAAVAIFTLAFAGLAYSIFPFVVIDRLTIWDAATHPSGLKALMVGTGLVLPFIVGYTIMSYRIFRGKASKKLYD